MIEMRKNPPAHEIMIKANELKVLLDRHGIEVVSRVNRIHIKEYFEIIISNIKNANSK